MLTNRPSIKWLLLCLTCRRDKQINSYFQKLINNTYKDYPFVSRTQRLLDEPPHTRNINNSLLNDTKQAQDKRSRIRHKHSWNTSARRRGGFFYSFYFVLDRGAFYCRASASTFVLLCNWHAFFFMSCFFGKRWNGERITSIIVYRVRPCCKPDATL